MDGCTVGAFEVVRLRGWQRSTLLPALWINVALSLVRGTAGVLASPNALLADALDPLGNALIYGFSL